MPRYHFRGTDKLTNNKDCKIINLNALLKLESLGNRRFDSVFVISDDTDSKQSTISFLKDLGFTVLSTDLSPHFHKTLASNPINFLLPKILSWKCYFYQSVSAL